MKKRTDLRKQLAFMRRLLCLPIAMLLALSCTSLLQEAHHDFPNSTTIKAIGYISPFSSYLRGASCTGVSAGASASTIQSALTACNTAGGGTVFLADGAYAIAGNITIPCSVSLSGTSHPYQQTHYQTAILTGSVTQPIRTTAGCGGSAPYQHLSYIEWNGNQQNNGGGGVNVEPGTNGFVIDHDYFHGATTTSNYDGCCGMAQVLFSGGGGTISNPTQNVQVTLSEFGSETVDGDCGAAMQAADTEASQGLCVGILNDTFSENLSWDHNIFHNLEQGAKVVEATTNGGSTTNSGNTTNLIVSYNYFYNIHRINYETQSNFYSTSFPTTQTINFNVSGNRDNTANTDSQGGNGQQNYDLSIANGCGNPPATTNCSANVDFNVDIQDQSFNHGAGYEIWGDANTHGNYGYFEGRVAIAGGAYQWSKDGAFVFNNNTFNIISGSGKSTSCNPGNGGYWNSEGTVASVPTCTGNTFSSTGTGTIASALPTIAQSSGVFTLTNTGTNRDANTSIWFTTDGSTPVPGSGTALIYSGPFSVGSGVTVKAVGMWGAVNQPYSYPTNYGYVPSAVVQATSGGGGSVATPTFSPVSGPFSGSVSVTIADATSGATIFYTTDGSTPTTSSAVFSTPIPISATSTVNAIATASGLTQSAVGNATYTLTNPTLTGGFQGNNGSINTMTVGSAAIQQEAFGTYSTGPSPIQFSTTTNTDPYGNTIVWASSNTTILQVSSTGLITCLTAGNASSEITSPTGFSQWVWTCQVPTLSAATVTLVGGGTSVALGGTVQACVNMAYTAPVENTKVCGSGVDIYGNGPGTSWTSLGTGIVTSSSSGLLTGISAGSATVEATVGSFNPNLGVSVSSTGGQQIGVFFPGP